MKPLSPIYTMVFVAWAALAEPPSLTLRQAEDTALRNHPQISVADLRALAAAQVTREVRSAYFPSLAANVSSAGASSGKGTRLGAIGTLNTPSVFDRNAEGLVLSQLLTDFGRTINLSKSAALQAQAAKSNAQATREQILLAVDSAFYAASQAQAVTRVAAKTVATRQLFLEQVSGQARNKLKSDLDVSFARVNLNEGKLVLSKAQNDLQAAFAQLTALLGSREATAYRLAEEPMPPLLATNVEEYVRQGLANRPDLQRLRYERDSAQRFARAENALNYPVISAVAAGGIIPVRDPLLPDKYAAAGVNLNLPLFTGNLYSARQKEAALRAQAAEESLRDAENNVIRDVRIAWLNAQNAYERLQITAQLAENAALSYQLVQSTYAAGLSSIVEYNQAELNKISADIAYANTQYEYLIQRATLNFQTGAGR